MTDDRVAFPLLADSASYVACRWDLTQNRPQLYYWLGLFRKQFKSLTTHAVQDAEARGLEPIQMRSRAEAAREQFMGYLDLVGTDPGVFGRLDIHKICLARERCLRACYIDDPYLSVKASENRRALAMLPQVLEEIDATPDAQRSSRVVRGIFAGNIFDLGAMETVALFLTGRVDFQTILNELSPRPWLIDDLDAWVNRLEQGPPHKCAVLFVDNAGTDVVLGMIPLARELLRRGTGVVLTSNTTPALNDITHVELGPIVQQVAQYDEVIAQALASGALELVPSGNGSPLIDLAEVSPELAERVVARGVDLVVLEGMGRAVESNLDAKFSCDAIKVAMVKDAGVAEAMGGEMYDLVFRYEPAVQG
ncbi:MAG: DUF89 family protein [Phycisphaera sp.]|nr:DUF89 family protein [Phycisphaera sp.]